MNELVMQKLPCDPEAEWVMPAAAMIRRELFNGDAPGLPEIDFVQKPDEYTSQYGLTDNGRLVAFARLSRISNAGIRLGIVYELKHIAVTREYQRRGIGTFLLRCMEREASCAGASVLAAYPLALTKSDRFYEGCGYDRHGHYMVRQVADAQHNPPASLVTGGIAMAVHLHGMQEASVKQFDNRGAYL